MPLSVFYVLLSLILLYFGASWLVKGSSALALKAGISPLVTGLTVVAFGTSSPELFVSINAALAGHGNIAIGNVIGSNMFNICVILGISAIISPLTVKMQLLRIDIPVLTLATLGFVIVFADRHISRMEGLLLFAGIIVYILLNIFLARRHKGNEDMSKKYGMEKAENARWYLSAGLLMLGIAVLVAGSEMLVKGGVQIARSLGVGETIISITIISIGTSMPELASSVVATMRKEYDIALGNVIGSSIFNILAIIGISGLINPISAIAISNIDLYIMSGVTLMLFPFLRSSYMLKRDEGIFMIILYLMYMYYLWPR